MVTENEFKRIETNKSHSILTDDDDRKKIW